MADFAISLVADHIARRRFGTETLRILEAALASGDVPSLLAARAAARRMLRLSAATSLAAAAASEEPLAVADFFARAFALAGDVESCLAMKYEVLVLRETKYSKDPDLRASYEEWLTFAKDSLDNGFYTIASTALENALVCMHPDDKVGLDLTTSFPKNHTVDDIKGLQNLATSLTASRSVKAQSAEYLKRKAPKVDGNGSLRSEKARELPADQRADAVSSLVYEANARMRDPVYGCVGAISYLQNQVSQLQMQLAVAKAEILCFQMQQDGPTLVQQQQQQLQQDIDEKAFLVHDGLLNAVPHQLLNFPSSGNVVLHESLKRESLWT